MSSTLARRFRLGFAIAALGVGWCFASDHYWSAYPVGLDGDLVIAFPFYVLGVAAMLELLHRVGTTLTAIAIAALEALAYEASGTSTSSTAGLAFLAVLFYGTVLVVIAVIAQMLVDALTQRPSRQLVASLSEAEQTEWAEFMSHGL